MLSNKDIEKELGKNIAIYPLRQDNIKGASINLTASNMAWSVSTRESIVHANNIIIPAHDTALIETNEVLGVSKKIAGTYHSRVKNVSVGLGHIGTTLNPGWIGRSLIAVHNILDKPITLEVNNPFVTICFFYLNSKTTRPDNNAPGRRDVLQAYNISNSAHNEIYEVEYNQNFDSLIKVMKESDEYKSIKIKNRKFPVIWSI
jgi:deoxycytidine triphosphate deaminase